MMLKKIYWILLSILGITFLNSQGKSNRKLRFYSACLIFVRLFCFCIITHMYGVQSNVYEHSFVGKFALVIGWIASLFHHFLVDFTCFANNEKLFGVFVKLHRMLRNGKEAERENEKLRWFCLIHMTGCFLIIAWSVLFWYNKVDADINPVFYNVAVCVTVITFVETHVSELLFMIFIMSIRRVLKTITRDIRTSKRVLRHKALLNKLCFLCREANFLWKLPMTTLVAQSVVEIWAGTFLTLHYLVSGEVSFILWAFGTTAEVLFVVYRLLIVLYLCECVYDEMDRLKNLIHYKMYGAADDQTYVQLETFSLQLLLQKVQFKGYGFALDMTVMFAVVCTVSTYVTILLQYTQYDEHRNF